MSWTRIRPRFIVLREACFSGRPVAAPWQAFTDAVREGQDAPPFHLVPVLQALTRARAGRPPGEIVILDHGCGGGTTLIYLLALGYTGINGVDLLESCEGWNRLLKEIFAIEEPRFHAYDGRRLPLADRAADFVFSQQVLEHVRADLVEAYYKEEGRILKPGALAYHQVPHRLAPYDSHTRTWFIHYLPLPARRPLYRVLGRDPANQERKVHLRWPGFHRSRLLRHIGPFEDLTLSRLKSPVDESCYDGPVRLRRFVQGAVTAPLAGPLLGAILKNLVMLQTVAVRRAPPGPPDHRAPV